MHQYDSRAVEYLLNNKKNRNIVVGYILTRKDADYCVRGSGGGASPF